MKITVLFCFCSRNCDNHISIFAGISVSVSIFGCVCLAYVQLRQETSIWTIQRQTSPQTIWLRGMLLWTIFICLINNSTALQTVASKVFAQEAFIFFNEIMLILKEIYFVLHVANSQMFKRSGGFVALNQGIMCSSPNRVTTMFLHMTTSTSPVLVGSRKWTQKWLI
jgi:hypothetical protein